MLWSLPLVSAPVDDGLTGFTGWMADVIVAFGEVGVLFLLFVETVFPPIPSEIVLSLAGWQAEMGRMNLALTILAATTGAVLGGLVFYYAGLIFGEERAKAIISRVPLMDREDLDKASEWFHRHGPAVVFFGRFIPIVRSLVSIPAGAQRMRLSTFLLFTAIGSGIWNSVLVGAGYLLGTQYELIEEYTGYFDYVVYAVFALLILAFVVRQVRKRRRTGAS